MTSALLASNCCCTKPELPYCNGTTWAAAPATISVSLILNWRVRRCDVQVGSAIVGCGPPVTAQWTSDQVVSQALSGTLYKAPQQSWPQTMYVGNDPASEPLSDSSAAMTWSVSLIGSGNRIVPVQMPGPPPYTCDGLAQTAPNHSDGGTLYPLITVGCVTGYDSQCEPVPAIPPLASRPLLRVVDSGIGTHNRLANTANSLPQWPVNVVYPGQVSAFVPIDTLDAQEKGWPPIIPNEPPNPNTCSNCSMQLQAGQYGTCWWCRQTCVPYHPTTQSYLSPIGYGSEFVSETQSLSGPWRLGSVNGGLCSDCSAGSVQLPACPSTLPTYPSDWQCSYDYGTQGSPGSGFTVNTGSIYGSASITI